MSLPAFPPGRGRPGRSPPTAVREGLCQGPLHKNATARYCILWEGVSASTRQRLLCGSAGCMARPGSFQGKAAAQVSAEGAGRGAGGWAQAGQEGLSRAKRPPWRRRKAKGNAGWLAV